MSSKKSKGKKVLIAASVAGLMAMTGAMLLPSVSAHADEGEKCYGVNACKGTGACGGKGHSCAGMNSCEGKAYLSLPAGTCTKIKGGSLEPTDASE